MAARKVLVGFAVLALGVGITGSLATAFSPCSYRACSEEVAASGLSGQARGGACVRQVIADCRAGLCSCTGGSPPCSCGCGTGCVGPPRTVRRARRTVARALRRRPPPRPRSPAAFASSRSMMSASARVRRTLAVASSPTYSACPSRRYRASASVGAHFAHSRHVSARRPPPPCRSRSTAAYLQRGELASRRARTDPDP